MNRQKIHWIIDWGVIITFILILWSCCVNYDLWKKVTYIAPVYVFLSLGVLFLNHISLKECFFHRDLDFFLMSGGILLGAVNMVLIKSGIGAMFTLANFLIILYLADKICFDRIQLGAIALSCLGIWFYWQFINPSNYYDTMFNPNGLSIIIFSCFCVVSCYLVYLLSACFHFKISNWMYWLIMLPLLYLVGKRVLSFNARGVLAAIFTWAVTYYLMPKKKFTVCIVLGISLLLPVAYVYLWKSGTAEGVMVLGKRLTSGRDIIWNDFYHVFIQHPITGIGSNFEQMLPDLYLKEVHHALLDLLFVHGIPVFCAVLYLLYKQIRYLVSTSGIIKAAGMASIYGMLAAGTFENYYIVSPYNILFFMVFLIVHAHFCQQEAVHPADVI